MGLMRRHHMEEVDSGIIIGQPRRAPAARLSNKEGAATVRAQLILGFIVAGAILLATGFVAGKTWTERRAPEPAAAPPTLSAAATTVNLATIDVPGADVPGLPRYPGATRVEYRQVLDRDLVETEVEYVVADDLEVVHDYYRNVFEEKGWKVADLGVYQGEWTFFVIQDRREALMELESRGPLIEIEIEITEPLEDYVTVPADSP